ncbi:MAG TPA: hypothetical protein VHX38_19255 [Pseudonocardiaceae bacterium]|jgi:hypothetical protein|nr:hypothetical protein [Pseudonocardiaceae bacterium]
MITVDSYVEVEPGSDISYDVRAIDEEVEVTIGSRRGLSSAVRLLLSDPATFTDLVGVLTRARDEFECKLHERRTASGQHVGAERPSVREVADGHEAG